MKGSFYEIAISIRTKGSSIDFYCNGNVVKLLYNVIDCRISLK